MTERTDKPKLSPRVAGVLDLDPDNIDYKMLMGTLRVVNGDLGLPAPVAGREVNNFITGGTASLDRGITTDVAESGSQDVSSTTSYLGVVENSFKVDACQPVHFESARAYFAAQRLDRQNASEGE